MATIVRRPVNNCVLMYAPACRTWLGWRMLRVFGAGKFQSAFAVFSEGDEEYYQYGYCGNESADYYDVLNRSLTSCRFVHCNQATKRSINERYHVQHV